jgi:hypothetical protein
MGGPGSGSWYHWQCKPRVEAYRRLDIRQWHRQRMLQPGRIFAWAWYTHEGAVAASMLVHIKPETVILTYRYRRRDETWQAITESVALTWTPCHYGGQRAWFRCPGHTPAGRCDQRVAILYGAGAYFLCRSCHDLRYESERENPPTRWLSKAQKIRERLGGSASLVHPFPPKPPKMRWTTYWQREAQAQEAAMLSLGLALAHDDRLRQRHRTVR